MQVFWSSRPVSSRGSRGSRIGGVRVQGLRASWGVSIGLFLVLFVGCSTIPAPGVAHSAAPQPSAPVVARSSPAQTQPTTAERQETAVVKTVSPTTAEPTRPGLIIYKCPSGSGSGICQMRGDGTDRHVVVPYDPATEGFGMYPEWSPDGQHFTYKYAYTQEGQRWETTWLANRDGGQAYPIGQPSRSAASEWGDANTLFVYSVRADAPFTQTYHLDSGVLTEGGPLSPGIECRTYAWSPDEARVAVVSPDEREVSILNRASGERETVFTVPEDAPYGAVGDCEWSPDGQELAFASFFLLEYEPFGDLYVVGAGQAVPRRLTDFRAGYDGRGSATRVSDATWSPDGEWLAFLLSFGAQGTYLAVIPAQGGQITNLGVDCTNAIVAPVWSPDSRELAFVSNRPFRDGRLGDNRAAAAQWDIYTVDIRTRAIRRLTNDRYMEMDIGWR